MQTPLEIIDSHCHLDFDYSPKTADDLVREANTSGVRYLMTIGTEMKTLAAVQGISERIECVYHSVGVHPHEAKDMTDMDLKTLEAAAAHPKCRAIGEIGLDYFYDHSPHDLQRARLKDQLDLALTVGLPVVIHARDAEADLLPILDDYAKRVPGGRTPGAIHCFTGTEAFGRACLDLGFLISFSGIVTFPKAFELQQTASRLPLERLMVETDAPFLAPTPFRGKKCEPAMVVKTAEKIALLHGVPLATVAEQTTRNARSFFSLPA